MNYLAALTATHATLATLGYAGLIATNVTLLVLYRQSSTDAIPVAIRLWRNCARIFGPMIGLGVVVGIFLATQIGISLATSWLLVAYVFIAIGMLAQAGIMIPWQLAAASAARAGERVSTARITTAIALFTVAYLGIMLAMVARPS